MKRLSYLIVIIAILLSSIHNRAWQLPSWQEIKSYFAVDPGSEYVVLGSKNIYADFPKFVIPGKYYKTKSIDDKVYIKKYPKESFDANPKNISLSNSIAGPNKISTNSIRPNQLWYVKLADKPMQSEPDSLPFKALPKESKHNVFRPKAEPFHSKRFEQLYKKYYSE